MTCIRQRSSIRLPLPYRTIEMGGKMRDASKDEAEFILIVGKFKTHDGDHREADIWGPGGHLVPGIGAHFCKCQPHGVPRDYEDPESRRWARGGWG